MIWTIAILTIIYFVGLVAIWLENEISEKGGTATILTIIYAVILSIVIIWNCFQRVNPGEVGVVVNLFGSHKGVEDAELGVGYHFIKPWCNVYRFPIFEQNHQWTGAEGFNFQTKEGLSVHADIGITFHLEPDYIHNLFARYRRGMDEITHLYIRNNIRDAINKAASKMTIEELYGSGKELFFDTIQAHLKTELQPLGFVISHLYIIGQFQVPDSVMTALNRKIEAIQLAQQRENEIREAEAQARKEIAKISGEAQSRIIDAKSRAEATLLAAGAEASANLLIAKSLTKQMIEWQAINTWDGKLPQVLSGKEMPFILNTATGQVSDNAN